MAKTFASGTGTETTVYSLSTWPGFIFEKTEKIADQEGTDKEEVGKEIIRYEGRVNTPYGTVSVVGQRQTSYAYTNMEFIYCGQVFTRREPDGYSTRYLRTLAHRFAEEVAKGEFGPDLEFWAALYKTELINRDLEIYAYTCADVKERSVLIGWALGKGFTSGRACEFAEYMRDHAGIG